MTWETLWSVARVSLGLTSEEFWRLAPRQLVALGKVRRQENIRQEMGPGMICSAVAATAGIRKSPFDFMPSLPKRKQPRTTQSWQEQLQLIKLMHGRLTGAAHGA